MPERIPKATTIPGDPLSARLREATKELHSRAERTGFMRAMARGAADRQGYATFLRNLLPAYEALEGALDRHAGSATVGRFAHPPLYRAAAMVADLDGLTQGTWREALPLLPAARDYASRVEAAATGEGQAIIAHAYVRYMADLSGGQVLKRVLVGKCGLDADTLSALDFREIDDLDAFRTRYRRWIDAAGEEIADSEAVVSEAAIAFELNIAVSEAVMGATAPVRAAG